MVIAVRVDLHVLNRSAAQGCIFGNLARQERQNRPMRTYFEASMYGGSVGESLGFNRLGNRRPRNFILQADSAFNEAHRIEAAQCGWQRPTPDFFATRRWLTG